jgi:hypothetical protein
VHDEKMFDDIDNSGGVYNDLGTDSDSTGMRAEHHNTEVTRTLSVAADSRICTIGKGSGYRQQHAKDGAKHTYGS